MRNALRLVIPVLITCIVAAAGLALTYSVTAPKIAEQDRLAEERSLQAVLPDAAFTCLEDSRIREDVDSASAPVDVIDTFQKQAEKKGVGYQTLINAASVSATTGTATSSTVDNSTDKYLGAEITASFTASSATTGSGTVALTIERSTDAGTTWPTQDLGAWVGAHTLLAADGTRARRRNILIR